MEVKVYLISDLSVFMAMGLYLDLVLKIEVFIKEEDDHKDVHDNHQPFEDPQVIFIDIKDFNLEVFNDG